MQLQGFLLSFFGGRGIKIIEMIYMNAIDKLAWELTISEQMIKCKTADDLLIQLRFKIDLYLNKDYTDWCYNTLLNNKPFQLDLFYELD